MRIGIYQFRRQSNGKSLPGARKINTELFLYNQWYDYDKLNVLLMQWGQFLAHDISLLRPDNSVGNLIKNTTYYYKYKSQIFM